MAYDVTKLTKLGQLKTAMEKVKTELAEEAADLSELQSDVSAIDTRVTTAETKLSGIAEGANKTVVDTALSSSSTNPVQNKVVNTALAAKVPTSRTVNGKALSANITLSAADVSAIPATQKGAASGVAELDSSGKVPSSQLPSYVDDVIEGYYSGGKFYEESAHTTEITGETGKIYTDLSTNKTYRWSGSAFVEISASLALGETSSTAYRGDYGKIAYTHSQSAHAPSDAEKNVIITVKKNGTALDVDSSRAVDITFDDHTHSNKDVLDAITASFTTEEKTKLSGIATGANKTVVDTALSSTSTNPVTSKAIYAAIDAAKVTVDTALSSTSTNPVQNKALYTEIAGINGALGVISNLSTTNQNSLVDAINEVKADVDAIEIATDEEVTEMLTEVFGA